MPYVTSTHLITDTYKEILLLAQNAKVQLEASPNDNTSLILLAKKKRPYEFFTQNGTLTIRPAKTKWYHAFRIGADRSQIKLSLPSTKLEKITVRANTGSVAIRAIACGEHILLQANTGSIQAENVFCKVFDSKGNAGAVALHGVSAQERISIRRNTGKILLNDCTAPEIFVKTNTGRVCGKLPTNVVFTARTKTGKIEVPQPPIGEAVGGRCEIKTNTGSIRFT